MLVTVIVDNFRRENDMSSGDEEDLLALAAFRHKEAAGAFSPGRILGTDAETERAGKRPADLDSGVRG